MAIFRRHRPETMADVPDDTTGSVPSAVRILRSEDELRDALKRADAAAKLIAARTTARSSRYAQLIEQLDDSGFDVRLRVVDDTGQDRQTG